MRKAFLEKLTELAERDPKVIFIVGDVGFSFIEAYRKRFPNQYLNAGIGEQNMMGLAVGMAHMGWKPAIYTMRNFVVFRPYEQVRNDIAHGNADVMLFGVSGSAAYAFLGISHNVIPGKDGREDEDIEMMRRLPNMNVYTPKTDEELREGMEFEYKRKGPSYFII